MYKRRRDANHASIARALQLAGCSVADLSAVGGGVPDLAVARAGRTYWLEVKNPKGFNRVLQSQSDWALRWNAPVSVVRTAEEALRAVGL